MTTATVINTSNFKRDIIRSSTNMLDKVKVTRIPQHVETGVEQVNAYVAEQPMKSLLLAATFGAVLALLLTRRQVD